jgi:hypothetical protein
VNPPSSSHALVVRTCTYRLARRRDSRRRPGSAIPGWTCALIRSGVSLNAAHWPTHNASQALRLYGRFQTRNPCFFSCGRGQVAHAGGTLCKAAPLVPAFRDAGGADGRSRGEQLEAVRGTEPWATANKQRVAELMARRALHVHVCIVSMWGSTQEPQARGARATAARAVSPAVTARAHARTRFCWGGLRRAGVLCAL